jgi:hypothetical protein
MQRPLQYSTAHRSWGYTPPMVFSKRFALKIACSNSSASRQNRQRQKKKVRAATEMQSLYHEPPLSPVSISALTFAISSHDKFRSAAMRNEALASAMGVLRPSPSWLARRRRRATARSLENSTAVASSQISWLSQKKAPETPKMQEPSLTHDPEYAEWTTATAPPRFRRLLPFACFL